MKGPTHYPSYKDRERALDELQKGRDLNASAIIRFAHWSRIEPRIAETLVTYLSKFWRRLSPMDLNDQNQRSPWPAALGVLLEFAELSVSKNDQTLYQNWRDLVLTDVPPAPGEQFFIGLRKLGGHEMLKDVINSSQPYLRWGYFGRDQLNRISKKKSLLSPLVRRRILNEHLRTHSRLRVADYLRWLSCQVHPRTAQRDLDSHPHLKKIGATRGLVYLKVRR